MDYIFKHNARSFFDVYNALINAYPRKPTWIFKEMAALFDFQSELMNRIATDILYPKTREAAYAFAARCDYTPVEADGAIDTITFTLTEAKSKLLPIGYQVGGISSITGNMVIYETTAIGNSGGTDTITVAAKQKKTYTNISMGLIDSQDDFMDYPIDGYLYIIKDSFQLYVNGIAWTRVDNFDNSTSSSTHFRLIYQSSGRVRYQFGDGINGRKPPLNSAITCTFEVTEGLNGRMDPGTITINVGGDSDISSVTNTGSTGGNDSESVASIIRNSRANVRLREIVWSKEDLEIAARKASSSVQKALGLPGIGSASVHIVPSGGGTPAPGLLTIVENYIVPLTQFGGMLVVALAPNYVTVDVTAEITVREGFDSATVLDLTTFALSLPICEYDNQILEYYDDYGIDACRENLINSLFSLGLTSSSNDALEFIINQWKYLLADKPYRQWGQPLEVGDLWVMGNSLIEYGVDVFDLISPTSNISTASDEIIALGTVVVSES